MTVNGMAPDANGNVVVDPPDLTELEERVAGIGDAVSEENRRAVGAEEELGGSIAAEASRAKAAEQGLRDDVSSAQTAIADRYTKRETDEKIAAATPSDYDAVKGRVSAVEAKVPSQATAQNQLADKAFVNSSIATNTAFYISDGGRPFQSLADLENYEGALTNNDYAFVVGRDAAGNTTYTRYKWNDATETWGEEYVLNNSSFTAEQWAAISSGVTSGLVAKLGALPTAEALAAALAEKASTADATLTPVYSQTPTFSEWTCVPAEHEEYKNFVKWEDGAWQCYNGAVRVQEGTVTDFNATVVSCYLFTATRVRTDILGYRLGPDTQANPNRNNLLASEVEAEALRKGKLDKSGGDVTGLLTIESIDNPNLELRNSEAGTSVFLDAELSHTKNHIYNVYVPFSWPNRNANDDNIIRHRDLAYLLAAYRAPMFGSTAQYAVGDFCRREIGGLQYGFRCVADHTGVWNSGHFALVLLPAEIEALDADFAPKLDSTSAAPAWVSGTAYTNGAIVTYNGVVYQNISGGTIQSAVTPDTSRSGWEAKPVSGLFLPLSGGTLAGDLVIGGEQYSIKFRGSATSQIQSEWDNPIDGMVFCFYGGPSGTNRVVLVCSRSGRIALAAPNPTAGHLATLDSEGNLVDAGIAAGDLARYAHVTKTLDNGAAVLDDRAINAVALQSGASGAMLTLPAAVPGRVRDFIVRLTLTEAATVSFTAVDNITWDSSGDPSGTFQAGTHLLSFTEVAPGVFRWGRPQADLTGQTFDFSTTQGVMDALAAVVAALGGSISNKPSAT